MDKANIKKLARILDRFTELESSFVLTEDIKAISKHIDRAAGGEGVPNGTDIITSHGTFHDSMDFGEFKMRVGDMIEAMKDQAPAAPAAPKVIPIQQGKAPTAPPQNDGPPNMNPVTKREVDITFGKNGANGKLFDDDSIKVVNKSGIYIQDANGSVVAKCEDTGQVKGEMISGLINSNGKYTLTDKGGVGRATIVFSVQKN